MYGIIQGSVNMASMTSAGPEHGISRVLRPRVQPPIHQFREGAFLDVPSSTMQSISSPVRIATAVTHNNRSTVGENGHSLGKMGGQINGHLNYGFHGVGAFNPHSLPDFRNGQSNGISCNLGTISPIGVKSNSRTAEGMESRHLYKVGSANLGGHSSGHTEGTTLGALFTDVAICLWRHTVSIRFICHLFPFQSFS